jgi:hypothetical protein
MSQNLMSQNISNKLNFRERYHGFKTSKMFKNLEIIKDPVKHFLLVVYHKYDAQI